jgi:hypothetical protein
MYNTAVLSVTFITTLELDLAAIGRIPPLVLQMIRR